MTFASVHDSYWSHAADSDTLAELLREEFVAIHSRSLLDDLRNEVSYFRPHLQRPLPTRKQWLARYGDYLIHRTRIPEFEKQAQGDLLDELRENGSDAPGELADSYIPLRHLLPDPPPVGEFDINLVRGSTYFFN